MTRFLGVGWAFPVEKDPGTGCLMLAGYEESIKQAIWIILNTAKGERVMRPDFGCNIHELVFAPNDAATRGLAQHHVKEALRIWEPRIDVLEVNVRSAGNHGEALHIGIEYCVRKTDNRFNLVYPFYLERGLP